MVYCISNSTKTLAAFSVQNWYSYQDICQFGLQFSLVIEKSLKFIEPLFFLLCFVFAEFFTIVTEKPALD